MPGENRNARLREQFSGPRQLFIVVSLIASLCGCSNTASLKGPTADFVSAANALAQAESDYMDQIQAASDASYAYGAAEQFVIHGQTWPKVAKALRAHDDFSRAKDLRVRVMTALVEYAQQLQILAQGADASWLAQDTKDTTDSVTKLLGDASAVHVTSSQKGIIEAAVTTLGQAMIENATADKIRQLAEQAKAPIAGVRGMVERDDVAIEKSLFASGLEKDQESSARNILHHVYDDKKVNAAERYLVVSAIQVRPIVTVTKRQAILQALAKLEEANKALAENNDLAAGALAKQATLYAYQAITIYSGAQ